MWRGALAAAWLCGGCAGGPPPADSGYEVRVTHVQDGDSFQAQRGDETLTVRLHGIDCPERGQPFADAARRFATEQAESRDVWVVPMDQDDYGRVVARVHAGRLDLNLTLVAAGHCWHYARYSDDPELAEAERTARRERRGLWAAESPVPPWEFRRRDTSTKQAGDDATADAYRGNTRSRVFHRSSCSNATCPSCTQGFTSRQDATAASYRPAGCCRP